ncbi:MAG: pilus assembly protein PilM [Phycisphaerae bacterium]|nr:pilus assembly protein PilM [Phycisphaerae bacterium]
MIGDRNIVCIDCDERSLRVVDATLSRSSVRIRQAVQVRIAEGVNVRDPASLGDFLRRTLRERRIRTRRAVVDIPRQDVALNLLSLPSGSVEDMAAMVQVQAVKDLPFVRDQAVIDFAISGEPAKGAMADVWVAAARSAVVDRYRQAIVAAGLKLDRIGLRPYANVASLDGEQVAEGRTLMVDVGPTMSEINVLNDGRLAYSRAASVLIPPAGLKAPMRQPVVDPDAVAEGTIPLVDDGMPRMSPMDALLIEVSRTVEAYRATAPGATIDRIILAGREGVDQEVADRFESRFGAPTRLYEVPSAIRWRRGRDVVAAPFSAAIGLAISSLDEGMRYFDFLHPKEPEAVERVRRRRRPMAVITVALFVAAAGLVAYWPLHDLKSKITDLKTSRDYHNRDAKAREELLKQTADIDSWSKQSVVWIDQLKQLIDVFPSNQDCYIEEVTFNERGEIKIDLVAKDELVATRIVDAVAEIRNAKGKAVFSAKPGKGAEAIRARRGQNPGDSPYPVKDAVHIQVEALAS